MGDRNPNAILIAAAIIAAPRLAELDDVRLSPAPQSILADSIAVALNRLP